jgi:hypothetical protein
MVIVYCSDIYDTDSEFLVGIGCYFLSIYQTDTKKNSVGAFFGIKNLAGTSPKRGALAPF